MRRVLPLALVIGALLGAGCGDDATVATDDGEGGQAETRFLQHAGLTFGAFRRYILQPYQDGRFDKNADGRRRALANAALAGAFATDEVRLARDAASSSEALRRNLIQPIDALSSKLEPLVDALEAGGAVSPGSVLGAAGAVAALKTLAAGQGLDIKERSAPIPGT